MKAHTLYVVVRVEVESEIDSLSGTVQEFERHTEVEFSDTGRVRVSETELLRTTSFNHQS